MHQRRDRHAPAVVDAADDVLDRDPRVLDEELVELGLARDLDQRADVDAVLLHVHQEVRQPAVLGRVRVGAREQHAPLGLVRERRPHLLAGDDVLVALEHRARLQRGEVGARLGLGEALAPHLVGRQDRREEALLLVVACRARSRSARPSSARARSPSAARARARTPRRRSPARSASRRRRRTRSARSGPAQPRSLSLRCQSRRKAKESSSPSGSRPGWLSAIQARSVSRNSSSAGESVRSTRRKQHAIRARAGGAAQAPRPARPAWAARRSPRRPGSARGRRSRRP